MERYLEQTKEALWLSKEPAARVEKFYKYRSWREGGKVVIRKLNLKCVLSIKREFEKISLLKYLKGA